MRSHLGVCLLQLSWNKTCSKYQEHETLVQSELAQKKALTLQSVAICLFILETVCKCTKMNIISGPHWSAMNNIYFDTLAHHFLNQKVDCFTLWYYSSSLCYSTLDQVFVILVFTVRRMSRKLPRTYTQKVPRVSHCHR